MALSCVRKSALRGEKAEGETESLSTRASIAVAVAVAMRGHLWLLMAVAVLLVALLGATVRRTSNKQHIRMPSDRIGKQEEGTKWAILIAGSSGYHNYRHQADVCHAYHILRNGGLEEENIVVFMYDDIANDTSNPQPGQIINHPLGSDVYAGVPKDYTGSNVTVNNFLAALLGDKDNLTGGSGKVVDSGPNDHIFLYYSDHGGPGVLGFPNKHHLYADDLINALQKKHDAEKYKEMVIYMEACESGSIFEGLLPDDLNIYVTTSANAEESSWATYCHSEAPSHLSEQHPSKYFPCLGDLYSVAWMEESEINNITEQTLKDQYSIVRNRTSQNETYVNGSHVMQYGNISISAETVSKYLGNNATNKDTSIYDDNSLSEHLPTGLSYIMTGRSAMGVDQRDADLLFLQYKLKYEKEGSQEKLEAQEELAKELSYREHLDKSVDLIGKAIFGDEEEGSGLNVIRQPGSALVDDWSCLKTLVRTFELHCGSLRDYGLKHMRAFANICNAKVTAGLFEEIASSICGATDFSRS